MKSLSSSFHTTNTQLLQTPSFRTLNVKPMMSTANNKYSSFTTFNPIKKLFKHRTRIFDQTPIKNIRQPPSKHLVEIINKSKSLLVNYILNPLDDFICTCLDPVPLPTSIDPKHVLSGNFLPVDELSPTTCAVVEGSLPPCLDGAYIRNGPNPQFIPKGPYHLLDGDGMLHVIKISRGEATFCSRYVKTHKYETERAIGYPIVPNFLIFFNGRFSAVVARLVLMFARILIGEFDPFNRGLGVGNTSVALLASRLFVLCESDLPYEVKVTEDGDVVTLGRHDFYSNEPLSRMTAHPKIDRVTGEAFGYGYNTARPFLTFYRIDCVGRKQKDVPILSVEKCAVIHDFAVTENYAVFCDAQIVVEPLRVLRGRSPVGIDPGKIPRLGIIRKYAADESGMRWVDAPGFNMLHCANAWEEDGGAAIVMVASNIVSVERIFEFEIADSEPQLTLEKMTINVEAKTVQRRALSSELLDFAVINPAYAAKKNRYVYAAVIAFKAFVGVVKLDLSLANEDSGRGDCTVASRLYGPGCSGGEPFFVAREPNNPASEEDDGYLITYVHYENTQESKFLVMDAKSPTLDIIAAVKLPQRVPNGFHGLFVSESDFQKTL